VTVIDFGAFDTLTEVMTKCHSDQTHGWLVSVDTFTETVGEGDVLGEGLVGGTDGDVLGDADGDGLGFGDFGNRHGPWLRLNWP
jgi:hypothetical protein